MFQRSFTIENSIIAGNSNMPSVMNAPNLHPGNSTVTVNNSLIGVLGNIPTGASGSNTLVNVADPKLGPLADNGGPTQTHALLPDSDAINNGSSTIVMAGRLFNTGVDANGNLLGQSVDDPNYNTFFPIPGSANIEVFEETVPAGGFPFPQWIANDSDSRWIGFNFAGSGDFIYSTTFNLTDEEVDNFSFEITGKWASDNFGTDILLNEVSSGQTNGSFNVFRDFTISTGFQAGLNTLEFVVNNAGDGPSGLRVDDIGLTATTVTDQRGQLRNVSGVDIGAFERQAIESTTLVVSTNTDIVDGDHSPGQLSLREAVNLTNESPGPGDTITFDASLAGQTITLSGAEIFITEAVTIDATALDTNVTIDAEESSRIFGITATEGDFTLAGLTLTRGKTTTSAGGAIYSASNGNLTLTRSTVSGSSTTVGAGRGGGIYTRGSVTLNHSTISGNKTIGNLGTGGGISAAGAVTLNHSTVSGNSTVGSAARGGGIFTFGDVTLSQSTVTDNHADNATGGGIYNNNDPIVIDNSIIAGNTAGVGMPDLNPGTGTLTVNYSLIGTGITPDAGTSGNNISSDSPLLGPLADNGGQTMTHALLPLSPAIDAGAAINFPLSGTATQSTTFDSRFVASNALDGDPATATATASSDINPSWQVELTAEQVISHIVLHNRDSFQNRLRDVTVEILNAGGNVVFQSALLNANNIDNSPNTITVALDSPQVGKTVRVTRTVSGTGDDSRILSLADVEVFGVDQRGLPRIVNGGNGLLPDIGAFEAVPLIVNSTADTNDGNIYNGTTTLREAITQANAIAGAEVITFDPSVFTGDDASLIRLNGTELEITDTLTIDASMASDVTITGDENSDDFTDAEYITNVAASISDNPNSLDDNSRVLNFSSQTGDLTLDGPTVTGGRTTGNTDRGGGIRFRSNGSLSLTRSTVSGNSTAGGNAYGGGISSYSGDVSLTSSTVSGNSVVGAGGGVFVLNTDANPSVTITNSIVAGNLQNVTAPNVGDANDLVLDPDSMLTIDHSLIGVADSGLTSTQQAAISNANSNNLSGSVGTPLDPRLGPLADNGGPTQTHALLPLSDAIDAGSATFVNVARNGTTSESSATSGRDGSFAVDGDYSNTTHTNGATDTAPFWRVDLASEAAISQIVLHNRTPFGSRVSRLRDITVEILDANDGVLYTSALLNPENVLGNGTLNQGPATLDVDLVALTGGPISGRSVRVSRTIDPDNSGTGGAGGIDDQNVLSLAEVEVFAVDQRGLPFQRVVGGRMDIGAFESQSIDFGDAPESYGTTTADGGASHQAIGPRLGANRDGEFDGAASPLADGDDTSGADDDDGVMFGAIVANSQAGINIDLQNAANAKVDAWIDFNQDGQWDANEKILNDVVVNPGLQTLNYSVPSGADAGITFARVRVSTAGSLSPNGPASDGEVEDYAVTIGSVAGVASATINNGRSTRSEITSIEVTFNSNVEAIASGFVLTNEVGQAITGIQVSNTGNVATLTFTSGAGIVPSNHEGVMPTLANGTYELRYRPSTFDSSDTPLAIDDFFRKYGDDDSSNQVGLADFAAFRASFGLSVEDAGFNSGLDANRDGNIGLTDFAAFRSGFGN